MTLYLTVYNIITPQATEEEIGEVLRGLGCFVFIEANHEGMFKGLVNIN